MKIDKLYFLKKIKLKGVALAVGTMLFASLAGVYNVHAEEADAQPVQPETESSQPGDSDGRILPNVYVGGTNVGGMTLEEAKNACAAFVEGVNASSITFTCGDNNLNILWHTLQCVIEHIWDIIVVSVQWHNHCNILVC